MDRAGGEGIHADALGAEFIGQVPDRALQRRLDRAHHVVVPDHPLGGDEAERQERPAIGHQRLGAPRQPNE